jgi:ubiquinone/menaquinone biosynthesis C-methylase UbiE
MTTTAATRGPAWAGEIDQWRCVGCGGPLAEWGDGEGLACASCGRGYPVRDGVVVVEERQTGNNEVVRDFYNGPLWPKFRFWEWFTFFSQGGERRCRDKVLRHLPRKPGLKLLDVAIGDGVYLPWLPEDWSVSGIDISASQLAACRERAGGRSLSLALGEAESLPYRDHYFDAVLSIGGFNYFNDPAGSLREMVRVTKPGGTIVISDEVPDLTRYMLGHRLNFGPLKRMERWVVSRLMHLGDDFTYIVERHSNLDVEAIGRSVLHDSRYEIIWRGVGYVLVGTAPPSD